jgi:hypothetical protein
VDEARWRSCEDSRKLVEWLRGRASDRKLRLFVTAFWREWWRPGSNASPDDLDFDIFRLLEYAEQWAEAGVSRQGIYQGGFGFKWHPLVARNAFDAANWTVRETAGSKSRLDCMRYDPKAGERAGELQVRLLRCVFGNPFRPSASLPPAVLAWNDVTVRRIAEASYEQRHLPEGTLDNARLAILADALLDAGCDNEELIAHCRQPGPHYRGCWPVDAILGKA